MKTSFLKTGLALLLAFGFVQPSFAVTYVRIGGAQAFGDAVHRALAHLLGATGGSPYTLGSGATYAYTGTDINKAQQTVWSGTIAGVPVIVKTSFTGSTDGVRLLAQNLPVNFLDDSVLTSGSAATVSGKQLPTSGNVTESVVPDASAVDSFQNSTVFTSNPPLVDKLVGAGAYVFVASQDAPASVGTYGKPLADATAAGADPANKYYPGLTNITTQQAQALYNVGHLPLAVFTGVGSDRTTTFTPTFQTPGVSYPAPAQVFATGRDYGSGARIIAFIEAGIGANANVQQYKPTITGSGTTGSISSHELYPSNIVLGIPQPVGNDGNTSNGNLATTVLTKHTFPTLGGYYISYLPTLDAANAVAAGAARILAYNGVHYSPQSVADGSYSLWAFEHILYKPTVSTEQKTVLDSFSNQLLTSDATLLLGAINITRPIDGGIITPTY